jgi:methylated-DNA-[protein]-cysteine S-methyltransferase
MSTDDVTVNEHPHVDAGPEPALVADLRSLSATPGGDDAALLAGLTDRLAARADATDLLDVAYRITDSPFGPLLVAATPRGVVRVAFAREDHERVLASLAAAISPRILRSGRRTDDVARQLDEYFAGRRRTFDLPIDLQLVHGFRHTVISRLPQIPFGSTASYAAVARMAGRPAAVRAVGSACSHNPVPLVVPCHRVVRSDGSVGQYLGGTEAKVALLELEAA